jgi:hypothetical protein
VLASLPAEVKARVRFVGEAELDGLDDPDGHGRRP